MKRLLMTIALLALALSHYTVSAQDVERTRKFASERCTFTLPAPDFVCIDPKLIPGVTAAMVDDSGTVINLLAATAPGGGAFGEAAAQGFEQGFFESGAATKIDGRFITFRDVPCYKLRVHLKQGGLPAMIRVFAANGYVYQVQLVGDDLPIDEPAKLEPLFSAFDFIGIPQLSRPAPKSAITKSLDFSRWMGRVVGICIIAIIVILPIRYFVRKSRKAGQSVGPQDEEQEDGER